ncbi:MAG: PEP-CTERM sorting domain-containing protein [Phycisphaerales bacterium]|nr:PEP-CTERM sorting domain-containing protein [Phycisphaerales bacterium]
MSRTVFLAASAAALFAASTVSADVIAQWTFETSVPVTAGPHAAEGGALAASSFASGFHGDLTTIYSNPVGNGSAESFSSDKWAIGDYYQFSTSTSNYTGITITWDQTRSNTGPATFDLIASTDGFATSTVLLADYVVLPNGGTGTTGAWSSTGAPKLEYRFGPVAGGAGLDSQATVSFRMVNKVTPGGTAGTNRVDNVTIEGTFVPAPSSAALIGLAGLVASRRRRA